MGNVERPRAPASMGSSTFSVYVGCHVLFVGYYKGLRVRVVWEHCSNDLLMAQLHCLLLSHPITTTIGRHQWGLSITTLASSSFLHAHCISCYVVSMVFCPFRPSLLSCLHLSTHLKKKKEQSAQTRLCAQPRSTILYRIASLFPLLFMFCVFSLSRVIPKRDTFLEILWLSLRTIISW